MEYYYLKGGYTKNKNMVLDFAKEAIENTNSHSINFDELKAGKAAIKVIGTGGCGCNMITWLFNKGINGASVYAANTDALHLSITKADDKILIGKELTRGLGAGGKAEIGREAAKESLTDLKKAVSNSDMVFVTCGLGGGTGSGAAPVVAEIAKKQGALVIGVVTLPFTVEGAKRIENAMDEAKIHVDAFKSTEEQVTEIVKAIKKIIPISPATFFKFLNHFHGVYAFL